MSDLNQTDANVAIFFCRQLDHEQDANRRSLEKELGPRVRFFPLPCSGRIEALHFLKALETGARKVYIVACPEGACRYGQGNIRAAKRVNHAKALIREIGLPDDCFELITAPASVLASIDDIARGLLGLGANAASAT